MEKIDYKKIRFKCGLEIHRQLESGEKLFCHCPAIIDKDNAESKIKRRLRSVAGEAGKKDIAVLYEEGKGKTFFYEFSPNYACLTDLDEQPPYPLNERYLKIAMEISLLLHAKIEANIKILRKTILNGSNVSAFQRTCLIAKDGWVDTSKGKVNIPTIYLEEDAARKMKETKDSVTYRLDRLGTPLVEISTSPDIKDAEHAKETASLLGMILKSTNKVKVGIGTIRQDVNISIKKHPRVELKGFQDLRAMPKVIDKEIERQLSDIISRKKIQAEVRRVNSDGKSSFLRPLPGEARMYIETDVPDINITKEMISSIKLSELITEKIISLGKKYNLPSDISKQIIKQKIDFDDYTKNYPRISPLLLATTLTETIKEIKKRFNLEVPVKHYKTTLNYLNEGRINKDAIIDILVELTKKGKINIGDYKGAPSSSIEKEVKKIVQENKGASLNAVMGIVMGRFRGRVEAGKLVELIKKFQKP